MPMIMTYFDSFSDEQIPEKIKRFIGNKNKGVKFNTQPITYLRQTAICGLRNTGLWFDNAWKLLHCIHSF